MYDVIQYLLYALHILQPDLTQLFSAFQNSCKWSTVIDGQQYTYDFRYAPGFTGYYCIALLYCFGGCSNLCLEEDEYVLDDGFGHTYFANICGNAVHNCEPENWVATYEYGTAVMEWGATPVCNATTATCVDKVTGDKVCCTADCQVLGVMDSAPAFSLIKDNNPNGGIKMAMAPVAPNSDDPFWCPWNVQTGSEYPFTVTYMFVCDKTVTGRANPLTAVENSTQSCE